MSGDMDALVEAVASVMGGLREIRRLTLSDAPYQSPQEILDLLDGCEGALRHAASNLPALLERVEAAEGALADVWDAGATAAGGYGHEDGWTHDMSPYLDNPYRAALNGADHGA